MSMHVNTDDIIVLSDESTYLITQIVAFDNNEYLLCIQVDEEKEQILNNGKVIKRDNDKLSEVTDQNELLNLSKFLNIDLKDIQ